MVKGGKNGGEEGGERSWDRNEIGVEMSLVGGDNGAKLVIGGKACKVKLRLLAKLGNHVFDQRDGKHVVEREGGRCTEGSADAADRIILRDLEDVKERFGWSVGPEGQAIGEDREDDGMVDLLPIGKVQSTDRVAHDLESPSGGACPGSHHLSMMFPGE